MNTLPQFLKPLLGVWLSSLLLLVLTPVQADETEIFFQNQASSVNPNVLFLMDSSGSMADLLSDGSGQTRMDVLKETFRQVMEDAPPDMNVGLMHYANSDWSKDYKVFGSNWSFVKGVNFPTIQVDTDAYDVVNGVVDNLPDPTPQTPVRTFLADIVDSWTADGPTPIVDSLFEAMRYFRGEAVFWGKQPPSFIAAAHPSTYTGGLDACTSPVKKQCGQSWGECNGTEDPASCKTVTQGGCCNWITDPAQQNQCPLNPATGLPGQTPCCENNDFTCTEELVFCTHDLCPGGYEGDMAYTSPIEHSCQANYLVVMSDGRPEYPYRTSSIADGINRYPEVVDPDAPLPSPTSILIKPDMTSANLPVNLSDILGGGCQDAPQGFKSGKCGPELTRFLADTDQAPELSGTQNVLTYTVAYALTDDPEGTAYLNSLATAEEGAFSANNADELSKAFRNVLNAVQKNSYSFASPSYAIDENSVLSHGSSVYIPVFDSMTTPQWPGNLRKFTLSGGQIVDAAGNPALDENSRFRPQARDLWSSQVHGSDVTVGGAANKLPAPDARKLWTDVGSALVAISADNADITSAMLTPDTRQTKNRLVELNGDAGPTGMSCQGNYTDCNGDKVQVFGDPDTLDGCVNIAEVTTCPGEPVSTAYRTTLLNFVRGYKDGVGGTDGVARNHMGDMLNSKPVVVDYGDSTIVFSATNEGFLHALDAETGVEKWAFMPAPLLKNQDAFFRNDDYRHHIYGIDGPLSIWRQDKNSNGQIDGDDKVFLYFGLRRGGRMYYALDITDPDSKPVLKWRIGPSSTVFATLGETWSRPTLARIRLKSTTSTSGELKYVMVFGGGYDPVKDTLIGNNGLGSGSNRPADTLGHDVYMVDAETGALVWSVKRTGSNGGSLTGGSQLQDSIPGDIRILDMDNNGSLDRLYFSDTGGNVWRVDMEIEQGQNGTYDYSKARLTKLAELGGGDMNPDNRMFFYEPDVALRLEKGEPLLTVALGSGYRTHPLSADTEDRFYVLRDKYVYTAVPANDPYYPILDSALVPRDQMLEDSTAEHQKNFLEYEDKKGWYYPFTARYAEKVLAPALTFLDKVLFTTFSRTDENGNQSVVNACQPATNMSRAYVLDIMTGAPVANLDRDDGDGGGSKDDFVNAGSNEILDMPQVIFGALTAEDGGECTAGDCYQTVTVRVGKSDLPLLDNNNTTPDGSGGYSEMVDLTRLLPRVFWKNDNTTDEATATTTTTGN